MFQDFSSGKAESQWNGTLSTSKNHAKKHRFEENFFSKHKIFFTDQCYVPTYTKHRPSYSQRLFTSNWHNKISKGQFTHFGLALFGTFQLRVEQNHKMLPMTKFFFSKKFFYCIKGVQQPWLFDCMSSVDFSAFRNMCIVIQSSNEIL